MTAEEVKLVIATADEVDWTVYGLSVRRNGTVSFIDPQITWAAFRSIATALGFECNEYVHVAARR